MVAVTFLPDNLVAEVQKGTNLMTTIIKANLPIGSSCSAEGVCARCFVKVVEGMENLTAPTPLEKKLLVREKLKFDVRISCLTRVNGPVVITTSYW